MVVNALAIHYHPFATWRIILRNVKVIGMSKQLRMIMPQILMFGIITNSLIAIAAKAIILNVK